MDALVSIYIISKDRKKLLRRAIRSCRTQTYKNIEVIVVDDASSTFKPETVLEEVGGDNIILFKNEISMGANFCRNIAIKNARGKYITGLDDDDYFHPKRIEILLSNYDPTTYSAVSTRFAHICYSRKRFFNSLLTQISQLPLFNQTVDLSSMLNNNLVGNQVLTEKKRFEDIGLFDEELSALQDYDMWLRLIKSYGPVRKIAKILYFKDIGQQSITSKNRIKMKGFDQIINKNLDLFRDYPHCVDLHRVVYRKKILYFSEFLSFFKVYNRVYLLKLLLSGKVVFKWKANA